MVEIVLTAVVVLNTAVVGWIFWNLRSPTCACGEFAIDGSGTLECENIDVDDEDLIVLAVHTEHCCYPGREFIAPV